MELKVQLANNGQQLTLDDVNTLGDVAALADDRVLAELLHMAPFTGNLTAGTASRGIIPFAMSGPGYIGATYGGVNTYQVRTGSANGSVTVRPFRAVIGSRSNPDFVNASSMKAAWRDIRSAICIGGAGNLNNGEQTVAIAANASGNPRWDLVYAAVSVDANANTVTRKIKSPSTKVIAGQSVTTLLATTVTLGVTQGTAAASPTWPAVPADAGGTYYIPIAYVRVANGHGAASTIPQAAVCLVANMLGTAPFEGGSMNVPTFASQRFLTTAQQQSWGSTGTASIVTMPPIAQGTESLIISADLSGGGGANVTNGMVLDNSRDWSNRYFRWHAVTSSTGTADPHRQNNSATYSGAVGCSGMGHSFGTAVPTPAGNSSILYVVPSNLPAMAGGSAFGLKINSNGSIVAYVSGTFPGCNILVWLEATSKFESAASAI